MIACSQLIVQNPSKEELTPIYGIDDKTVVCYRKSWPDGTSFKLFESGGYEWMKNGYFHRDDGPAWACVKNDGTFSFEWWLMGKRYTREDYIMLYEVIYLKEYEGE